MRTYNFNNHLQLIYCERDIWLRDGNIITVKSDTGKVGAVITITSMSTGQQRILNHTSDIQTLVFPLKDSLQYLYGADPNQGMSYNISVTGYINSLPQGTFSWRHEMANGVSLPFRSHGACRTIYAYSPDELHKIGVYANAAGRWTIHGYSADAQDGFVNFNFENIIETEGEHFLYFTSQTTPPSVIVSGVVSETPRSGDAVLEFTEYDQHSDDRVMGSEWDDSQFDLLSNRMRIIYLPSTCKGANEMEFRYLNTDGQLRHIKGRVLQTTMESSGTAYRRIEPEVYGNISRRLIEEEKTTVTVIFEDIRRDAYLDEIQFSPEVEFMRYDGEWMPCTVASEKLVMDKEETADWSIDFLISSDTVNLQTKLKAMTGIFLNDGQLDMGGADFCLESKGFIFNADMTEPFSTDFTIPKTEKNVFLLGASGLLDFTTQTLGTALEPVNLVIGGRVLHAMIQVVNVKENSIDICLFQRPLPPIMDKTISQIVKDVPDVSVYYWDYNSEGIVPDVFKRYIASEDSSDNDRYYQLHPTYTMNSVMEAIENAEGYTMPRFDDNLCLMASQAYVCPENTHQNVMVAYRDSVCVITASQHITNDAKGWDGETAIESSDSNGFTFNRHCKCNIKGDIIWRKRLALRDQSFTLGLYINDVYQSGVTFTAAMGGLANGVEHYYPHTFELNEGDSLSWKLTTSTGTSLRTLSCMFQIDYIEGSYDITDDDYQSVNLVYSHSDAFIAEEQSGGSIVKHYYRADFSAAIGIYNEVGTQQYVVWLDLPYRAMSYIGYYSSLPKISLKNLLRSLAWALGKRLVSTQTGVDMVDIGLTQTITAQITCISPSSDSLGQTNKILWGDGTAAFEWNIDNVWLVDEKVIHQSLLARTDQQNGILYIPQYKVRNGEGDLWNNDSAVICSSYGNTLTRRFTTLPSYNLTQLRYGVMEIQCYTYDNINDDSDFIIIDGRKFWIVEVTTHGYGQVGHNGYNGSAGDKT